HALAHRVTAQRRVDGALFDDVDRHGQRAGVELDDQVARLLEGELPRDLAAALGDRLPHDRRREELVVQEDAQRLADEVARDLGEHAPALVVELEEDHRAVRLRLEAHLGALEELAGELLVFAVVALRLGDDPFGRLIGIVGILAEVEPRRLADEVLRRFDILDAGQLDDDAVLAGRLDDGLVDAGGVDAALDDVDDALQLVTALVVGHAAHVRLEDEVGTTLEVQPEAEAVPLKRGAEEVQVDAGAARQGQAEQVLGRLARPDDDQRE